MFPKFDDKAYSKGYEFMRKGGTLRQVLEPMTKEREVSGKFDLSREQRDAQEMQHFSTVIGFVDGALDLLRKQKA